jgi:hypothetical protein
LLLEDSPWVVLLAHSLQPRLVRGTISADGILPRSGIVEVKVLVVQTKLLCCNLGFLEEVLRVCLDPRVVGARVPRHCQEQVEEVAVASIQTKRVSAAGLRFRGDCRGHGLETETVREVRHVDERLDCAVGDVEDVGHQFGAVAVRSGHEELPSPGDVGACKFEREVGEVGDAHGAECLWEGSEVGKDWWVRLRFGVLEVAGGVPRVTGGREDVAVDQGGVWVVLGAAGEGFEGGELSIFGADVVADEPAPANGQSEFVQWNSQCGVLSFTRTCLVRRQ